MASKTISAAEWGQMIAHSWLDQEFASLLQSDPTAAVRQYFDLDESVQLVFPLPPRPKDLTDEHLKEIRDSGKSYPIVYYCC